MKIGIVSDTHDHRGYVKKTMEIFSKEGCSWILHAGDFVAPFIIEDIKKYNISFIGVFGNNDGEKDGLINAVSGFGQIENPPYSFILDGKRFLLMHRPFKIEESVIDYQIIIYGHTHKRFVDRKINSLIINPGEACGWLFNQPSIAILNTEKEEVLFIEL
ncbi:MAG: metallophosphoesterase [Candidatus Aminicenantia bacterium]